MSFVTGLDNVEKNLAAFASAEVDALVQGMEKIAAVLETDAKSEHPWKPKTGNTDNSTRGRVSEVSTERITVSLSAGMSYDVFLELARNGKWSWLWPCITRNRGRILQMIQQYGALPSGGLSGAVRSGESMTSGMSAQADKSTF